MFVSVYGYSQYRQPTKYRDPQQLDISGLGNAMTTKQSRYNNNTNKIQNTINKIFGELNKMSRSEEQQNYLNSIFIEKCLKKMPDIDYSSDMQSDALVKFLYDCINYQLKNN